MAGHSPLLSHAGTICKPLIAQELRFYSQLESQLPCMVPFVPKFYGVLDPKQLDESAKRDLGLSAMDVERSTSSSSSSSSSSCSILRGDYSEQTAAVLSSSGLTNPWSSSIHQQRPPSSTSPPTYLVIEDLTYAYTLPCIIDLKLGKRQHGLHDSEEKIKSKQRKCALTTSKRLGVRLCGMQRYDVRERQWDMKDKYEGRKLTEEGFMDTLKDFFWNGQELRLAVMSAVLARLMLMRATLQQVKAWKFYSSSLLIVYEGSMEGNERVEATKSAVNGVDYSVVSPPTSPSLSPSLSSSAEAALSPLLTSLSAYSPTFLSQTLSSVNSHYRSSSSFALSCSLASLQSAAPASFTLPSASALASSSSCSALNSTPRSSKQLFISHTPTAAATAATSIAATLTASASTSCCTPHPANPPSSVPASQSSPLLTKLYTKRRKTTYTQAKERRIERGNVDVRLIDFAHTARVDDQCAHHTQHEQTAAAGGEEEEGLLFGFDTLIAAIARMMDDELARRNTLPLAEQQQQRQQRPTV